MSFDKKLYFTEMKLTYQYLLQQSKGLDKAKNVLASSIGVFPSEMNDVFSRRLALYRSYLIHFYTERGFKVAQVANKLGISRLNVYAHHEKHEERTPGIIVQDLSYEVFYAWDLHRGLWTPVIYSKDIQIKI